MTGGVHSSLVRTRHDRAVVRPDVPVTTRASLRIAAMRRVDGCGSVGGEVGADWVDSIVHSEWLDERCVDNCSSTAHKNRQSAYDFRNAARIASCRPPNDEPDRPATTSPGRAMVATC